MLHIYRLVQQKHLIKENIAKINIILLSLIYSKNMLKHVKYTYHSNFHINILIGDSVNISRGYVYINYCNIYVIESMK